MAGFTGFKILTLPIMDQTQGAKRHVGIPEKSETQNWTSLQFWARLVADFTVPASARRWRRLVMGYEQCLVQVVEGEPDITTLSSCWPPTYQGAAVVEAMILPCKNGPLELWTPISTPTAFPTYGGGGYPLGNEASAWWLRVAATKGLVGGAIQVLAMWEAQDA